MQDYSMYGAAIGLLPLLMKMFKGDNKTSPTGGVGSSDTNSLTNFQGTGQPADVVAAVSPNPTQATQAYNAAGGDPSTGAQAALPAVTNAASTTSKGGIADALSGLTGSLGGTGGPSNVPAGATPLGPTTPIIPPNYAGSGTKVAGNDSMMMPGQTALNPLVMPSGPAATNPLLLAFLRARLGGIG